MSNQEKPKIDKAALDASIETKQATITKGQIVKK